VLFSSDRDGIFNIYAYDLESGEVQQVTNVIGGAFDPIVSNDGTRLAYMGFSSTGYDVWAMKLDPDEFFAPLPVQDGLPAADDPTPELAALHGRPPSLGARRYQPIRTMFPRVLLPASFDVGNTGSQGLDLGLQPTIADVVGFHSLSGTFREYFRYNEPTGSVSYVYSQLLPTFRVDFIRDLRIYDDAGGPTATTTGPARGCSRTGSSAIVSGARGSARASTCRCCATRSTACRPASTTSSGT
jgi:hypothetical protein